MKNHFRITFIFIFLSWGLYAQYHVNVEWSFESGNPVFLDWSHSIVNDSSELIHVGNSLVPGEGANVLISKYDPLGTLL